MTEQTIEQDLRDALEQMGFNEAQSYTAGDLVELANVVIKRSLASRARARKEVIVLRKLLAETLDVLPEYVDGRNDRLVRRIEKALGID